MAYRYHPEIEGLKVNEDGSEVIYCGESLSINQLKSTTRKDPMKYVYFNSKTCSVAKLVCESWHGMADNHVGMLLEKLKQKGITIQTYSGLQEELTLKQETHQEVHVVKSKKKLFL